MSGRIDFTMGINTRNEALKREHEQGFRIYILGDFSGRSDESWEQRKISRVDVDNFDQVMAQMSPAVDIESGLILQFETLEDFHPDNWLAKVQIIADLQKLKQELTNPNTAEQAAAKIQAFYKREAGDESAAQLTQEAEKPEDTLQRLLGKRPERVGGPLDSVDQFINQIISPYVKKDAPPQQQVLTDIIDSIISQYIRTLLHRADFQKLEALWLSIDALVNEENSDEHSFFLVDIRQSELLLELSNGSDAFQKKLLRHVQSGEGEQSVLFVGDYYFSDSQQDKELLIFCSQLARTCDGSFLGAVHDVLIKRHILDEPEGHQYWTQYLSDVCTAHVLLAYPRNLLRLPYGQKREPIEAFKFEECAEIPVQGELLWGNPAFLCARVLIRNQTMEGYNHFNDVPAFSFEQDDEPVLQPGAESVLTENQANILLSQGIIPVIGFRQRQGVRVISLTTLSKQSLIT